MEDNIWEFAFQFKKSLAHAFRVIEIAVFAIIDSMQTPIRACLL